MHCRNGRESSFEAQFYHPEEKKSVSIGLFYFKCPEDMEACEVEAARALDRVAFKFYDEKGWSLDRIQSKLSVRVLHQERASGTYLARPLQKVQLP
jgi:hypothetical protein